MADPTPSSTPSPSPDHNPPIPAPKSLSDVLNSKEIPNVNALHAERMSAMDRLALFITNKVGSMGFFFIIFIWTVVWLGWNIVGPKGARFDPAPAFVLWLFISNMVQIFLMPLIMVGQTVQARFSEIRADTDHQMLIRSEFEVEAIMSNLEYQNNLLERLTKQVRELEASIKNAS